MAKVFTSFFVCAITVVIFLFSFSSCEVIKFPHDFKFGIGTSAYQVEGSHKADGKGESIWDYMTHFHPENVEDGSNADHTAESYKNWKRDVEMIKELNVDIYRFSISWTRILPDGYVNQINKAGINYYNNLINELLHHNITPMVTMYHWDLPQKLQLLGGWTNPEIIDIFVDYAKLLLKTFGNRVNFWTTFNEPWHVCEQAYGMDYMAPAMNYPGIPSYMCGHNLLKAHAKVYHMYKSSLFKNQKGVMGITGDTSFPEPLTHTHADRKASERALQFYVGWFMNPIYGKSGNYPQIMIDRIDELSRQQGFSKSRLPKFTDSEIKMIHNTSDFFGINSYTSVLVTSNDDEKNPARHPIPSFFHDMGTIETQDESWPMSGSVWLRPHPAGMRHLLNWVRKEYNNPPVYVTENGVSDKGGLNDKKRIEYFTSYLTAVHNAMKDGCNVKGYIAWSLMDSFEWKAGFTEKFGLYHVDLNSPEKKRTPKQSAIFYSNVAKKKEVDRNYQVPVTVAESFTSSSSNGSKLNLIFSFLLLFVTFFLKY